MLYIYRNNKLEDNPSSNLLDDDYDYDDTNESGITTAQLRQCGLLLKNMLDPTEEQIIIAIKQNSNAFKYVKKQTDANCLVAVKGNGLLLEHVKNKKDNIIMAAIQQNSNALQFVENQTEKAIELAVTKNPYSTIFIKKPSKELFNKLARLNFKCLEYMCRRYVDDEMIINIWGDRLKKDGLLLKDCSIQTFELCKIAIEQNPHAIQYISNTIFVKRTFIELLEYGLKMNGIVIQYIINPTNNMKNIAINQNGLAIEFIANPSYELCKLAIAQNKNALTKIKNNLYQYILNDMNYTEYDIPIDNCNICYSNENHFMKYECKHMFCRDCSQKLHTCPLCRRKFTSYQLVMVKFI